MDSISIKDYILSEYILNRIEMFPLLRHRFYIKCLSLTSAIGTFCGHSATNAINQWSTFHWNGAFKHSAVLRTLHSSNFYRDTGKNLFYLTKLVEF